jgi:purine-binding chemotaxis protein CheW
VYEGSPALATGTNAPATPAEQAAAAFLLCEVGEQLHALPLAQVIETMRPLPIRPIEGAPPFVLGLSVVRGEAMPVVDAAALLGSAAPQPTTATRFVSLRVGERRAVLAVGQVRGIRSLPADAFRSLPPMLGSLDHRSVKALAMLDDALVLVLETARLVPDAVWAALEGSAP